MKTQSAGFMCTVKTYLASENRTKTSFFSGDKYLLPSIAIFRLGACLYGLALACLKPSSENLQKTKEKMHFMKKS